MTAAHPLLVRPAYPSSLTIHRLDFAPFASLFIVPHHGRQSPYLSPILLQLQALQSTRTICTLTISAPQAEHIHSLFSFFAQPNIFLSTTPKRHFSRLHQRISHNTICVQNQHINLALSYKSTLLTCPLAWRIPKW